MNNTAQELQHLISKIDLHQKGFDITTLQSTRHFIEANDLSDDEVYTIRREPYTFLRLIISEFEDDEDLIREFYEDLMSNIGEFEHDEDDEE